VVTKKERLERLGEVRLFQDLTKADVKELGDIGRVVHHPAGHTIIDEGETGAGFHLVLSGDARVVRGGKTVARLTIGDFFGEMALIDGGPRTASVVADSALTTFSIAGWDFRALVKRRPNMAWALLVHVTQRLRDAQRREDTLLA
jgi:CRP/FNR family transcriptional regulator, cyclic AMP receptor protein